MMMIFSFTLAGIAAFYVLVYRHWKYKDKFTFKTISIYILAAATVLNLWGVIVQVADVADSERMKTLAYRLSRVEEISDRGEYVWLADDLGSDMDYEEEFEYLWERVSMYSACNRYLVFDAAAKAGLGEEYKQRADEYKELLFTIGENPEYSENIPYGKGFLRIFA